jgi:hypothetical protein
MNALNQGFEMQVASCRRSGGAHMRNDLTNFYGFALLHRRGFQVVVG